MSDTLKKFLSSFKLVLDGNIQTVVYLFYYNDGRIIKVITDKS